MQVDDQINRTRDLQDKMDDIESRLQDLINSSRHSLDNSKAALDTNIHNERLQDDIDVSLFTCQFIMHNSVARHHYITAVLKSWEVVEFKTRFILIPFFTGV